MASLPTVIRIAARFIETFPTGIWLVLEDGQMAMYTGDYELRKLEVRFSRVPTVGVVQDKAVITFHLLNLTAGEPDETWTDADYASCETKFDAWFTAPGLADFYKPETKLAEYVWRADGPAFKPHGASLSPTLRITTKSIPGTYLGASEMLPPQCAATCTEVVPAHYTAYGVGVPGSVPGTGRTQVRNRWGRFYMPAPAAQYIVDGRWGNGFTDTIADKTQTLYEALVAAQFIPVVYSPTTGNSWGVGEIHVDDIVDVVRSRRYVTPLRRTPRTISGIT